MHGKVNTCKTAKNEISIAVIFPVRFSFSQFNDPLSRDLVLVYRLTIDEMLLKIKIGSDERTNNE